MSKHVKTLMGAYHDQELPQHLRRRVEAHLETCAECRAALERLQALSHVLEAHPLPEALRTPERFTAQVVMQLPHREKPARQRLLYLLKGAFPYGLAGLWGISQAVFLAAFILQLLLGSGLLAGFPAVFSQHGLSFWESLLIASAEPRLLDVLNLILDAVTLSDPYLFGAVLYLIVQSLFAGLFGAWLAGWYLSRKRVALAAAGL